MAVVTTPCPDRSHKPAQPFPDRLALDDPVSTACLGPIVGKAEKVEAPRAPCRWLLARWPLERNKYPPAKPEVLRWLAPQRGLIAIAKSKPKTEKTGHCRLPELSNFGSPPAEPGVYPD